MKLATLTARNLKGLSFTLKLDDMTVLVGDNFAGKSARTDAIRLLLLGYLPELGKTARATFGLCSGRELVVEGVFDTGDRIVRRWFLKGDVVKTEETLPPFLETSGALVSVMLNADLYFGLSERERVNYVFENIPTDGARDAGNIDQALLAELHTAEGLDEDAIKAFVAEFKKERAALIPADDMTPQEIIEWAVDWSDVKAKESRTAAGVMEKTAQGLAYLRTKDAVDPAELPGVTRQESEVRALLAKLTDEKAKLVVQVEGAAKASRQRAVLTAALANRPRLEASRKLAREAVENWEIATRRISSLTEDQIEEIRGSEREAASALDRTTDQLLLNKEATTANEKELSEVDGKTRCAYCGATGEGWKTIKRGEIESALSGLRTKRAQLEEHAAKVRAFAQQEKARLENAIDGAKKKRSFEDALRLERKNLEDVDRDLARLDERANELAALPPDDPEAGKKLEELQVRIDAKRTEHGALQNRIGQIGGRSSELRRLAQAEKERDQAKAQAEVAKAAAVALRWLKEKIVAELFGPLLTIANACFAEVLRTPLAYHEAEIGTWRDGTWVSHRTFSGAEKRLAYCAIQAALSSKSPFRIMLLDEMGTLGTENVEKVVEQIGKLVASGAIEQFVGIDVDRRELYVNAGDLGGLRLTVEKVDPTVPAS